MERRSFKLTNIRSITTDDGLKRIEGHAAVFDQLSEDLGGYREKIAPGAFTKTIGEADVRALFNHDPNFVLGRNKAGTLRLSEDETGLKVSIDPPDTQWAKDLMVSIDREDITQMSFGFRIITETPETLDGETVYVVKEVKLYDVSPVTFPAYPQTDVSLKNAIELMKGAVRDNTRDLPLSDGERLVVDAVRSILPKDSRAEPEPQQEPHSGAVVNISIEGQVLDWSADNISDCMSRHIINPDQSTDEPVQESHSDEIARHANARERRLRLAAAQV